MNFTKNQQAAIDIRDKNILVSAAAGAGKTAVLTNRIIKRIMDKDNPCDIDHMLIMTFTKAAAFEMRERIFKRIEKLREDYPDDKHLYRQSVLINNAQITTIHGFCQSIIKDNFHVLSIDPSFRVGDENECKLIKQDVLKALLEEYYSEGDSVFLDLLESVTGSKSDAELENQILKFYECAISQPNPKGYLKKCIDNYDVVSEKEFLNLDATKTFINNCVRNVDKSLAMAKSLLEYVENDEDIIKYKNNVVSDIEYIERIREALCTDDPFGKINSISKTGFTRLATITSKDPVICEKKDYVKEKRDNYKKLVSKIATAFIKETRVILKEFKHNLPLVRMFSKLVSDFMDRFAKKKSENNIIDFSDMEHLAIKVLRENPDIANDYRKFFVEIYVDEYQDSNMTQETLISLIQREDTGNLFMVGDVKQSIYRFRQARPDLFLGKYNSFVNVSPDDNGGVFKSTSDKEVKILLNDNFRSRTGVIDSVNEIFARIMNADNGGFVYDDDAALKNSAIYPKEGSMDTMQYETEYMLLRSNEEMDDFLLEATAICERIKQLHDSFRVWDNDASMYRECRYSDIAILIRSFPKWEKPLKEAFENAGIPVSITTKTGYFSEVEILTTLAFLSVIDNPYQDVKMATLLRSDIGGMDDENIAYLKLYSNIDYADSLYDHLKACCELKDSDDFKIDGKIIQKSERIIELIERYRKMAVNTPVYDILVKFVDEEYAPFVRCMYNGEKRIQNLNMLVKKAYDYSKTSYTGIFHFVRYIDEIRKYEIDFGEAVLSDGKDDSVKVMTIHKSKGLEFPICFVAGMSKKRNAFDEKAQIMFSARQGLGMDVVDLNRRVKSSSFIKDVIKDEIYTENLSEEMRVFYVALTRAREKLILSGVVTVDEKTPVIDEITNMISPDKYFESGKSDLISWDTYNDFLSYAYNTYGRFKYMNVYEYQIEAIVVDKTVNMADKMLRKDNLVRKLSYNCSEDSVVSEKLCKEDLDVKGLTEWEKRLSFRYPYKEKVGTFSKMSVSELKALRLSSIEKSEEESNEGVDLTYKLYDETLSGASKGAFYGTAFHRILELWDYSHFDGNITDKDVRDVIEELYLRHMIEQEQKDAVNNDDFVTFLNSNLALRMKKAYESGKLFREQPFVIGLEANEILGIQNGEKIDASVGDILSEDSKECGTIKDKDIFDEELCLVQGIIDAFFVEDDEIVIVDYKTDKVRHADELIKKYKVQLDYYERALSQILNKRVREKIIYSARLKMEIRV